MKIIIYDKTCPKLAWVWRLGSYLYCLLGIADRRIAATSWHHAFDQIIRLAKKQTKDTFPIKEIEYWGHGFSGGAVLGEDRLTWSTLAPEVTRPGKEIKAKIKKVGSFMVPTGVWWFRTCSSFSGARGHRFAQLMSSALGRRVAAHTYIIWLWHSGLHIVHPHKSPKWPIEEGGQKKWSTPFKPNTVMVWSTGIPRRIFRRY